MVSKTLICRQLFASHVVSSRPMDRKEKTHRMKKELQCYNLRSTSNHINIKKKNPADKQFLSSSVIRKLRWLEAYLSFVSCFFCVRVLCSCERCFILKPVKVKATCGLVSGKKTLTSCSVSFDDDREDSLVPGPFRARTWAGGPMTVG